MKRKSKRKNLFSYKGAWILNSNFTFLKVKFTFFLIKKIFPEEKNEKVKKWNEKKKVKKKNFFTLKGAWILNSKINFFKVKFTFFHKYH